MNLDITDPRPIVYAAIARWESATGLTFNADMQSDVSSLIKWVVNTPDYEVVSHYFTEECFTCHCRILPWGMAEHWLKHQGA